MLLLGLAILVSLLVQASGSCSYDDSSLLNWDDPAAWENHVPAEGEFAVIKTGSKVRLNVSPTLKGITIESGATLVWGNFDGLVVTTDHIHVKGTFIIGDSDCPFTNKANIKLTGKSNTDNKVPKFGMKVIGVDEGGTLEMHGAVKKSWTRLIQTMPSSLDHAGFNFQKSVCNEEMTKGLFVMVFNLDGSVFDFSTIRTQDANDLEAENKFKDFIEGVPTDKILIVAVNGDFGTGTVLSRDWETIYTTIESVGDLTSTDLRNVNGREAYAFITKTGASSTTQEQYVGNPGGTETFVETDRLRLRDDTNDLEFSVVGKVFSDSMNRGIQMLVLPGKVATPKIKLDDDVTSWVQDDQIVVTSTDFDWRQVEEFKLLECTDCEENEVRLDHAFEFMHYGEITNNVDQMAEVGLLTRTIRIEGVMEDECYEYDEKDTWLCDKFNADTHGGHLKIIRNFAAAHVENVELVNMGQQKFVGSYAFHFHMCDDVLGNWLKSSSIHHCQTRCVTIHGSDHAEVSDNVCYLTKGHSIFLEDSAEQWNTLDGNLVIGTEHGTHLLSDMKDSWVNSSLKPFTDSLSSFWLTHPNNRVINNVVAGSDRTGFWYLVANKPLGPSAARQLERGLVTEKHALSHPILQFENNTAHSCKERGLRIDHRIANEGDQEGVPENGVFGASTSHVPKDPPGDRNGSPATSVMKRFRSYKNIHQNVWTKAGNLVMEEFTLADSPRGIAMARSASQTFTEIKKSLFIGETDNIGLPEEPFGRSMADMMNNALQGVEFYQGPGYVTDCFFDKYEHKNAEDVFRPAGAVSFRRSSPYPSAPNSGVRGLTFGFCDEGDKNWFYQGEPDLPGFGNRDGNRQASFHDYDGSLTGTAGSQVVQNEPFFMTDRCSVRPKWGDIAVCPYEYARAKFNGEGGVFVTNHDDWAVSLRRDDRPSDSFSLIGERGDNYLVMKNRSYTLYFNGSAPNTLTIKYENLQTYDYVRIGICFPKDSVFEFTGGFPMITSKDPAISVATIEKLDEDTTGRAYFWDQPRGLLFVHGIGYSEVLDMENCPGMKCPTMNIVRTGSADPIDCYDDAYVNGPYTVDTDTSTPIPEPPACVTGTNTGYGVPVIPPQYSTEVFTSTLPTPPTYPDAEDKGCWDDDSTFRDLPYEMIDLARSMTVGFCTQRCYQRNYVYAALTNGQRCYCGYLYGAYEEKPGECDKSCTGGDGNICGAKDKISVYSTGIEPLTPLPTCGAGGNGAEINSKCYQLTDSPARFTGAQRGCVKMGGNLATITSSDIQYSVERFLRPVKEDVWFGLHDIFEEGTRQYVDGSAVPEYDNTKPNHGLSDSEDAYQLQATSLYKWNDRSINEEYRGLCELALDAEPPSAVSCGESGAGKQFDSGCYLIISDTMKKPDAEFACYTRMGKLATVDDTNRAEVLKHVYVYGEDTIDYLTANVDAEGNPIELNFNRLYQELSTTSNNKNGVICKLETLSASNPCGPDWTKFENNCYLNYDKWANFDYALSLCQQGESDILTIHSAEENTFVANLAAQISNNLVYIGYKYNLTPGEFQWVDGSTGDYSNWNSNQGIDFLEKGECSRVKPSSMTWYNRVCTKGARVMCKAPAFQAP